MPVAIVPALDTMTVPPQIRHCNMVTARGGFRGGLSRLRSPLGGRPTLSWSHSCNTCTSEYSKWSPPVAFSQL